MRVLYSVLFLSMPYIMVAQNFTNATKSGIDLKAYTTFTVVRGEVIIGEDNTIDRDAFFVRFKESAIRELVNRGYQFLDDSTAQLKVSYVAKTTMRMDVLQLGPMGQTPTTNAADVSNTQNWSREFRQGTLIVGIEDIQKKSIIWSAEGVMDATRTRGGDVLDAAVRNAFRRFPDKTKRDKPGKKKRG